MLKESNNDMGLIAISPIPPRHDKDSLPYKKMTDFDIEEMATK